MTPEELIEAVEFIRQALFYTNDDGERREAFDAIVAALRTAWADRDHARGWANRALYEDVPREIDDAASDGWVPGKGVEG